MASVGFRRFVTAAIFGLLPVLSIARKLYGVMTGEFAEISVEFLKGLYGYQKVY